MGLEEFNREIFTVGGRWISDLTFVGSPGERFDYSNIGSSLAACVVEQVARAAGLAPDYNTFVVEHIFAPLGVSPLAGSHYLRDFDGEMEPPLGALPSDFWRNSWESFPHYSVPDYPNGFWRSSSQTYAVLLGMVANRGEWGGVRLLSEASIEFLEERAPPPANDRGRQGKAFFRYGSAESRVIGHDGGELGIATGAYLDLESGVAATVHCHRPYQRRLEPRLGVQRRDREDNRAPSRSVCAGWRHSVGAAPPLRGCGRIAPNRALCGRRRQANGRNIFLKKWKLGCRWLQVCILYVFFRCVVSTPIG